jgi:hypothetical protein
MIADGSPKPARPNAADSDPAQDGDARPAGPEALSAVFKQLAEAVEYLAYLLTTQVDRVKLKVRNVLLMVALGVIGAAVAMAFLACTVWLLLSGIAGGVGVLLGDRPWLGSIVTAVVILLIVIPAGWILYRRIQSGGLKAVRERYRLRQAEQKARFGRKVEETAKAESKSA